MTMSQRVAAIGLVSLSVTGVAVAAPAAQAATVVSATTTQVSDSTTVGYVMEAIDASSFKITASGVPAGGTTEVVFTRTGALQTTPRIGSAVFYSGSQVGWTSAHMLVRDSAGSVVSTSPELHPGDGTVKVDPKPAPSPVVVPPTTTTPTPVPTTPSTSTMIPRTADSATLGAMLQGQANYVTTSASDLDKVETAVMQTRPDSVALVKAAKAKNPRLKVYAYINASAVGRDALTPDYQPSIVSRIDYGTNKSWHLKVAGTNTDLTWPKPYEYLLPIDVANPEVQANAAERAKALLADGTFDGIFLDDVNIDESGHGGQTGSFYGGLNREEATISLVKSYAAAVHSVGKKVAINYQQRWPYSEEGVKKFAPYVDNVLLEHFAIEGDGDKQTVSAVPYQVRNANGVLLKNQDGTPMMTVDYNSTNQWNDGDWGWKLREMQNVQAAGANVWTTAYIDHSDEQAQRFARAMFLMGWDGKSQSVSMPGVPNRDGYSTFWNDAASFDPGFPTGEVRELQKGVYTRPFSKHGLIVNASGQKQTVKPAWHDAITMEPGEVFFD